MEFSTDDYQDVRDLPDKRIIKLSTGNKINIEKQGPYGLWYIYYAKGSVPDELKGAYTTPSEAEKAVQVYLNKKNLTVKN